VRTGIFSCLCPHHCIHVPANRQIPGLSRTLNFNFQTFQDLNHFPEISRTENFTKKSRTFQEAWKPWPLEEIACKSHRKGASYTKKQSIYHIKINGHHTFTIFSSAINPLWKYIFPCYLFSVLCYHVGFGSQVFHTSVWTTWKSLQPCVNTLKIFRHHLKAKTSIQPK